MESRSLLLWVVKVLRSLAVHKSPGGYFHRVGSSKRLMSTDHLTRLTQNRRGAGITPFDQTIVSDTQPEHLDENFWQRFSTLRTEDTAEVLLTKLGMLSAQNNTRPCPTVAGILLASPDPQQHMPSAYIQAVSYRGVDVVPSNGGRDYYQIDAQDIVGTLDQQISGGCDFVRKNMKVAAKKDQQGGREDIPQYDMVAIFEAITNAVAHRDYSMWGSKIRLRMFADRLELYIPGGLVNTLTPETLPYRQDARNPTITSLLARCPIKQRDVTHRRFFMDKRGEGVPIILGLSEKLSQKTPHYRTEDVSELILTIYAAHDQS